MQTILVAGAALLLAWTASVQAQTAANPHAGHGAHGPVGGPQQGGRTDQGAAMQKSDPHAGHAMPPSSLTGPWAHTAAGSPPPYVENRWEVVPSGDSPLFVAADGLTREQRCGAINASKRMIVDEATRAACAAPLAAHGPAAPQAVAQAGAGVAAPATVNAVDAAGRKVNVTHGPIPQIGWPGMTMDLAVSERVDLKTVKPGDRVEMTLKQGADGIYMIDSLSK